MAAARRRERRRHTVEYVDAVTKLERDGERLVLPCEGLRVSQIRVDYAFGLELAEDQERATDQPWRIRINTQFEYSSTASRVLIDP